MQEVIRDSNSALCRDLAKRKRGHGYIYSTLLKKSNDTLQGGLYYGFSKVGYWVLLGWISSRPTLPSSGSWVYIAYSCKNVFRTHIYDATWIYIYYNNIIYIIFKP